MHFGPKHFFNPAAGGAPVGRLPLGESILKDLREGSFDARSEFKAKTGGPTRVMIALTGDFNERCTAPEFTQSKAFLEGFYGTSIFGHTITAKDIFMVPGNHDVKYAEETPGQRWVGYVGFYQDHNNKRLAEEKRPREIFDAREPHKLSKIINQSDLGLVVAEINSSAYVEKDTADERRGQVDDLAVNELELQLESIDQDRLGDAIKIALIHHHPVTLPVLYEEDKEYDAVLNSELLFRLFKRYGFHLLLHGHKHNPFTYNYDAVSAWTTDRVQAILIVAGGSAGSEIIPNEPGSCRTYNVIDIKWHRDALQARIHIETRGLIWQDENRIKLPAPQWYWKTLRTDDRLLTSSKRTTASGANIRTRDATDAAYDDARSKEIDRLRRNYPAIEVFPSLDPTQGYEARVWIEAQPHEDYRPPDRVEWSAAPRWFREIYVCDRANDPEFRARFSYYGPTLIQARLFWADHEAQAYVYARIPRGDRM
jgi:3',5'-cyclic AMP phosphodiesterase CpdA